MRQIGELLRLLPQCGRTYAECGRALGIAKSTAGTIALLARAADVDWAVAEKLTDEQLEARLYRPPAPLANRQLEPNLAHVHHKLKRFGVTLPLLWQECVRGNELAYRYTSFGIKCRAWKTALSRPMRQTHIAGERLFIDYAILAFHTVLR